MLVFCLLGSVAACGWLIGALWRVRASPNGDGWLHGSAWTNARRLHVRRLIKQTCGTQSVFIYKYAFSSAHTVLHLFVLICRDKALRCPCLVLILSSSCPCRVLSCPCLVLRMSLSCLVRALILFLSLSCPCPVIVMSCACPVLVLSCSCPCLCSCSVLVLCLDSWGWSSETHNVFACCPATCFSTFLFITKAGCTVNVRIVLCLLWNVMTGRSTVLIPSLSCPCPVPVLSLSSPCPVLALSFLCLCPVLVLILSCSCPVVSMSFSCHVQVWSLSSPCPVRVLPLCCPCHVLSLWVFT